MENEPGGFPPPLRSLCVRSLAVGPSPRSCPSRSTMFSNRVRLSRAERGTPAARDAIMISAGWPGNPSAAPNAIAMTPILPSCRSRSAGNRLPIWKRFCARARGGCGGKTTPGRSFAASFDPLREPDGGLRDIAAATAEILEVERVGIWFFSPDRQSIHCVELFERTPDCTPTARVDGRAASDLFRRSRIGEDDHGARCPARSPHEQLHRRLPLSVRRYVSVDAPIRRLGQTSGVICFEHTVRRENWTPRKRASPAPWPISWPWRSMRPSAVTRRKRFAIASSSRG